MARLRSAIARIPTVFLALVLSASWAIVLLGDGMGRIAAWYALLGLPWLGAVYLIVCVALAGWRRAVSGRLALNFALALIAVLPLTWLLRIWPMDFPVDTRDRTLALAVRVPTDRVMRVAWGGDAETNYHALYSDQRWAYDLMIEPYLVGTAKLEDFGCFGVPVVAPIAGRVARAVDGEPDIAPGPVPARTRPFGNHVVIEPSQGGFLILAHMKQGSVVVAEGDRVAEGQKIGACGNSGHTSEPHIHLHYQRQHPDERPHNFADGLPLGFRDHDGSPLPRGGIESDGERVIAVGESIAHARGPP